MKPTQFIIAALVASSLAVPAAAQAPIGIARVAWLQGCWELTTGARTVEEQWMVPRAKSMLGSGRTVAGDRLVEYELVVIREQGDGLAYEAHPSGQPSAVFLSTNISGSAVVFENKEHDYPQRVGYQHDSPDALVGWIDGTAKGQTKRVEFPYTRVACPAK